MDFSPHHDMTTLLHYCCYHSSNDYDYDYDYAVCACGGTYWV